MPKRLLVSILVVCLAAAGAWFISERRPEPAPKRPAAVARASGSAQVPATPPAPPPETRVRKLSAAEHQQLAERIAAARARARLAASSGHGNPVNEATSDDDSITLEQVSPTVRESLEQAVPILAECFHDRRTAVVQMTMYSDPSVGMVIDTEEMTDDNGQPLPSELDDCLRTTIDSLGLPPLDVGGHLPLQYSFKGDATGSSR